MSQSGTLRNLTGCIVDDGRLELISIVGAGAYGKLYKALDITSPSSSPTYFAVKCLRRPALRSKDAKFQQREYGLHRRMSDHPNIVTLHRHFVDAKHVFMVMDFCSGGDMYRAINNDVYRKDAELIKRTFVSLVDAVRVCHDRGVYHRDLKPENVLLDSEGRALLADFGLSTKSTVSRDMGCGSGSYMTPESFSSASSSYCPQHSDVWALCIILVNLVSSMNPWHSAQASDHRWNSFMADPDFLREILPISRPLNELLTRCFRTDPARRPSLAQLRHEVLTLPELFMSDADLKMASPGVRRAAGYVMPDVADFDPSDYSSGSDSIGASTSGGGYSSLDADIGRPVQFLAPAGLAPSTPSAAGSSLLSVPAPGPASSLKVPFASSDVSSVAESDGPLTPQAHVVDLPSVSSGEQQNVVPGSGKGKFKRFVRRLHRRMGEENPELPGSVL
ncbi:kinase-like domain-containing protein [Mycena epipterygia]|nr:kinase-like domain-containing protein [Mycena epipterygia]